MMFKCLECFDTTKVISYNIFGEELIKCKCKKEIKELTFIADLTIDDIKELIDLSLQIKNEEMFIYYSSILKEFLN